MKYTALLTLMIACVLLSSCKPSGSLMGVHQFDAVAFNQTSPPPASGQPAPTVWIDTNLKVDGLFGGGTVKSRPPYHLRLDFTDNSSSFAALVITKVEVTYDDGTVEAATNQLRLPHRIKVRPYDTVNSMSGGRIVKSTVNVLSGVLRNAVTRNESLTLTMEGFFITKAGAQQPFTINHHYTVTFDTGTRPLVDR